MEAGVDLTTSARWLLTPPQSVEDLTADSVGLWLAALSPEQFAEITEVRVARRQLDDAGLGPLVPRILQHSPRLCPRLMRLDLSGNCITDQGCVFLAECITGLRSSPGGIELLSVLNLSGNRIGASGAEVIALNFLPPPGSLAGTGEYTLILSENSIGDNGVVMVASSVCKKQCRTRLYLCDVECGAKGCKALTESLSWLSTLDLSYNDRIPAASLTALVAIVGPPLRQLGLSYLESARRLWSGGAAAQALSEALRRCTTLVTLNLAGNDLQDSGLKMLADAAAAGAMPHMKELDLAGNRISDGNILAKLLTAGHCLASINLESNALRDLALVALSAGIAFSPRLRRLVLARNSFGNGGAIALANSIGHQHSPKKGRSLQDSQFGGRAQLLQWLLSVDSHLQGREANAAAFSCDDMGGLEELDLSFNAITDKGGEALAEALGQTYDGSSSMLRLNILNCYEWSLGPPGVAALEKAVKARYAYVEHYAGFWFAAAGLSSSTGAAAPQSCYLPMPMRVLGLGFEALELEFVQKVRSWIASLSVAQSSVVASSEKPIEPASEALQTHTSTTTSSCNASSYQADSLEKHQDVADEHASTRSVSLQNSGANTPIEQHSRTDAILERARKSLQQHHGVRLTRAPSCESRPPLPSSREGPACVPASSTHAVTEIAASLGDSPSDPSDPTSSQATSSASRDRAGSNAALSRAEAVLSRARLTLKRVTVAAAEQFSDDADGARLLESHESSVKGSTQTSDPIQDGPDVEEPEGEALAVLERTVRLEREVAELSENVQRIERTMTSLNPEPECEADGDETLAEHAIVPGSFQPAASIGPYQVAFPPNHATTFPAMPPSAMSFPPAPALAGTFPFPPIPPPSGTFQMPFPPVPPMGYQAPPSHSPALAGVVVPGGGKGGGKGGPPLMTPASGSQSPPAPAESKAPTSPLTEPGNDQSPPKAVKGGGKGVPVPPKRPLQPPPKGLGKGPPSATAKAVPKFGPKVGGEKPAVETPFQRKLYWKQLDVDETEGTMFHEQPERRDSNAVRLDIGALNRMFESETNKSNESRKKSAKLLSSVQQKAIGLKLLSDHRARNIAIVLRRLPVTTRELARILRNLEWEAMQISSDDLEQIVEVIPTQEEAEKLREHRSPEEREKLRDVEQMVFPLALLSRASARVRLLVTARDAQSTFKSNARALAAVRTACDSIHHSGMLREVMRLALDLGNYINCGDSTKGAKAISIGSLLTLKDFKAGKISSLHFLCASLHFAQPGRDAAEVLARELRPVVKSSKIQVQTLQLEIKKFERDLEVITAECDNFIHEYGPIRKTSNSHAGGSPTKSEAVDDEEEVDEAAEELIAAGAVANLMAAASTSHIDDADEADATRWVEDVVKIRGSAATRLRCMRRVVEKLCKLQGEKMEAAAIQAQGTLKFCGLPASKQTKQLPNDLEPLLMQLTDFIKVFKIHWDEVRADLPRYQQLFSDGGGGLCS